MTDSMNQDAVTESGSDLQSDVSDMQWFVVQAFSGFEKHVQESLREYIRRAAMEDHFADIEVPTQQVVELRNGQKRTSERRGVGRLKIEDLIYESENPSQYNHRYA